MMTPPTTPLLTLTGQADCPFVAATAPTTRTVEWAIGAPAAAQVTGRPPLNLALVLDRSGSMEGDKLRYAQAAANHVLALLEERDRAAIVAYDDQIIVAAPSEPVTPSARQRMRGQVERLKPGGSTDLAGGWLAGCDQVATHQASGGLHRALLLTDGLANVGITDVKVLMEYARGLRARGVTTSTFGIGLDFNQHLLAALAEQGGGRFYYIERPAQIPDIFSQELGALLTTVANEAVLTLLVPAGVEVDLLGDLPHERQADRLRVFLGNIAANEWRACYARVRAPAAAPGARLHLAAELRYADPDGQSRTVSGTIELIAVPAAELDQAPTDAALLGRAGEVEVAAAAAQAQVLEEAGQRNEARTMLKTALAAAAPYMPAATVQEYTAMEQDLAQGLTPEQRKAHHFATYRKRQGRGNKQ